MYIHGYYKKVIMYKTRNGYLFDNEIEAIEEERRYILELAFEDSGFSNCYDFDFFLEIACEDRNFLESILGWIDNN